MSLAQRIVEGGESPRDAYELAGCARFTPRLEDVTTGLSRLAAENSAYIAHWNKETRLKGQQLQRQIEAALQTFSSAEGRQRYDDNLLRSLKLAYQNEVSGQTGEALKRWLRLAQNIHGSRIEFVARKLQDEKGAEAPLPAAPLPRVADAQPIEPAPSATAMPVQGSVAAKAPKSRPGRRPPKRPGQPDYFALPWIVGSAVATTVICLALLLFFFRDRFGGDAPNLAQGAPVDVLPPEPPANSEREDPAPETTPVVVPSESPQPADPESKPKQPIPAPVPNPTTPPIASTDPNAPPGAGSPAPPTPASTSTTNPAPTPVTPMPMPATPTPTAPAQGGARQTIEFGRAVHSIAWDSSGKMLAVAGEGGDVLIWDTATAAEARRLQDSFPNATCVAFNGRSVGVTTGDNRVIVWNAFSGKLERSLRHADLNDPRTLAWLPNSGEQVIIGDGAGAIRTYSLASSNPVAAIELAEDAGAVQSIVLSSNRPVAVSAHLDGTVVLWNLSGKAALKCLMSSGSSFFKALQKPEAASSKGAEISFCGHEICYDVALSPDETLLATAAIDLELWELDSARHLIRRRLLPGAEGGKAYRVVEFSPDGSLLAVGNAEGTLAIVDVAAWSVVQQEKLPAAVLCLNWHRSDSRKLAVGLENGQAIVLPLAKNISALKATPEFDIEKLLAKAKEVVEEEEWHDAGRLLAVLSAYQLPVSSRTEIDRLWGLTRKGLQALVDEIDTKESDAEAIDESIFNLQSAIDIDPQGKLGKDARAKIKLFPARTPATLIKLAAAENANSKSTSRPGSKPNKRFGRP